MTMLKLSLLGEPHISKEERPIDLKTRKVTALVAYLVVTAVPHNRDTLAALFWPEADTARAKTSLRVALSTLREALGEEVLAVARQEVGIKAVADWEVDVWQFRQAMSQKNPAGWQTAVALYRGDFLSGFTLPDSPAFDEWQFFVTEELRQLCLNALKTLVTEKNDLPLPSLVALARQWVSLDNLDEQAHACLIQLYRQSDQPTAAWRQFQACERILAQELGIEPSPQTKNLLNHKPPSEKPKPTPPAPETAPHFNIPVPTTSFVGRERELTELTAQLNDPTCRLLSIVAPGGMGKTRLAIALAERVQAQFPHGVCFVDLSTLTSPERLPAALSQALQLKTEAQGELMPQLGAFLAPKTLLLVLDNFEALLQGTVFLQTLLTLAPQLKLLLTSREALNVAEEWVYFLDGLTVNNNSEAGQLFVRRAHKARANFALVEEATAVAQICQLVEGMPLGLELAAAWVKVLSCADIAREIQSSLDFLASVHRGSNGRHQSLRAVFEQSWQRLTPAEQHLLAQLSLFRGGFRQDALRQISQASLFTLYQLANKYLVRRDGVDRYTLHELIRQFAYEKLLTNPAEYTALRRRHADYYSALMAEKRPALFGAQQADMLQMLALDMENIRLAWQWAVEETAVSHLNQLVEGVHSFYSFKSHFAEGAVLLEQARQKLLSLGLAADEDSDKLLLKLMIRLGEFHYMLGHLDEADTLLQESLPIAENWQLAPERFFCTNLLGVIHAFQGHYPLAYQWAQQAAAIAGTLDDDLQLANALLSLGSIEQALGKYEESRQTYFRSLAIYEASNYPWGLVHALRLLGTAVAHEGAYEAAQTYHQRSLILAQSIGHASGIALGLNNLAQAALALGQTEEAHQFYEQALALSQETLSPMEKGLLLKNLGQWLVSQNQVEEGKAYLHQALQTAVTIQAAPLALEVVLETAVALALTAQTEPAHHLLDALHAHPATRQATRDKATTLRATLGLPPPPDQFRLSPPSETSALTQTTLLLLSPSKTA